VSVYLSIEIPAMTPRIMDQLFCSARAYCCELVHRRASCENWPPLLPTLEATVQSSFLCACSLAHLLSTPKSLWSVILIILICLRQAQGPSLGLRVVVPRIASGLLVSCIKIDNNNKKSKIEAIIITSNISSIIIIILFYDNNNSNNNNKNKI
jgi:hypothetical protein